METATFALLTAASTKSPSATSSSEYSRESSPELHTWISPGEVKIEGYFSRRSHFCTMKGCDPRFVAISFDFVASLCTDTHRDLALHFRSLYDHEAISCRSLQMLLTYQKLRI